MNILNKELDYKSILFGGVKYTVAIMGWIYSVVPEDAFATFPLNFNIPVCDGDIKNILVMFNRLCAFTIAYLLICFVIIVHRMFRQEVTIEGKNHVIDIRYGNIFELTNCLKVINFDECYTTTIGTKPYEIFPTSICGQYLEKTPLLNDDAIKRLIIENDISELPTKSKFNNQVCYESGTIVPNGEYLLLAFTKLNKIGLGEMSRKNFLDCLELMWKEIDKFRHQQDVCIPILGSGVTHIGNEEITQQELLNLMIMSYELSEYKIKRPNKLIIVCRRQSGFSLDNVYSL